MLISDFQKSGWERQEEISLPDGSVLTPVVVGTPDSSNIAVTSVRFQRTTFESEERVMVTAAVSNRSTNPVKAAPVKLEVDGRLVDTRPISIDANSSGTVTFPQLTVAAPMRASVRAGEDPMPADNAFHFVMSPSRPVSVLIVQADGAPNSSFYLTTALGIGASPPFKTEVVTPSRATAANFERRAAVILNDAGPLATQAEEALSRFIAQGGGVFVVLGDRSPFSANAKMLPGKLGAPVERLGGGGATLGYIDHSHSIFETFKDPRSGNFSPVRFFKYRGITPEQTDKVLARFDDGAPALVERVMGSGRVVTFASTMDASWNDFPRTHLFLPLLHETVRYLAQYQEPESWYTVGRSLDVSVPIAAIVREGAAGDVSTAARKLSGVAVAPSGEQVTIGEGGLQAVQRTRVLFGSHVGAGRTAPVSGGRESGSVGVRPLDAARRGIRRDGDGSRGGDDRRTVAREPGADCGRYGEEAGCLVVSVRGRGGIAAG